MTPFRQFVATVAARRLFALAAALPVLVIAAQQSALAGCGDYVFVRDARGHLVQASALLSSHGRQRADETCFGPNCREYLARLSGNSARPGLPAPQPCQGPHCSGRAPLPAAPVSPPIPERASQDGTLLSAKQLGAHPPLAPRERAAAEAGRELHFPRSIFHPPRV